MLIALLFGINRKAKAELCELTNGLTYKLYYLVNIQSSEQFHAISQNPRKYHHQHFSKYSHNHSHLDYPNPPVERKCIRSRFVHWLSPFLRCHSHRDTRPDTSPEPTDTPMTGQSVTANLRRSADFSDRTIVPCIRFLSHRAHHTASEMPIRCGYTKSTPPKLRQCAAVCCCCCCCACCCCRKRMAQQCVYNVCVCERVLCVGRLRWVASMAVSSIKLPSLERAGSRSANCDAATRSRVRSTLVAQARSRPPASSAKLAARCLRGRRRRRLCRRRSRRRRRHPLLNPTSHQSVSVYRLCHTQATVLLRTV